MPLECPGVPAGDPAQPEVSRTGLNGPQSRCRGGAERARPPWVPGASLGPLPRALHLRPGLHILNLGLELGVTQKDLRSARKVPVPGRVPCPPVAGTWGGEPHVALTSHQDAEAMTGLPALKTAFRWRPVCLQG